MVPTFCRDDQLVKLWESLLKSTYRPAEIIIVNNAPHFLPCREQFSVEGIDVRVIDARLGPNVAEARNIGWRASVSELVFFIDDDNVVPPRTIERLVNRYRESERVGLIAPISLIGSSNVIWCSGIFRTPLLGRTISPGTFTNWDRQNIITSTCDAPNAFMIPRRVLEELDGFDSLRFPIHFEEADIGERMRQLGYGLYYDWNAAVEHHSNIVGIGSEWSRVVSSAGGFDRVRLSSRSRPIFFRRHSKGINRLSRIWLGMPLWFAVVFLYIAFDKISTRLKVQLIKSILAGSIEGLRLDI